MLPEPILETATEPPVFLIIPEKVPLRLLSPTVKTELPAPAPLSTVPEPERPLMVMLFPFRSSVPSTATSPLPTPLGIAFELPTRKVPALMVVL